MAEPDYTQNYSDPSQLNVLRQQLELCSSDPMTGYDRTGYCNSITGDMGAHTVCARLTGQFLRYSKAMGNDLMTPRPEYYFPGLKDGD